MPDRGEDLIQSRRDKLQRLRQRGIDPYPARYHRSHTAQEAITAFLEAESSSNADTHTQGFRLAGRMTALRQMGKASFADLCDGSGRIQVLFRQNAMDQQYDVIRDLDLGDFIGVAGSMMRTRTKEVTLDVQELVLLCKTLQPLPEKWHGLAENVPPVRSIA